AAKSWRTLLRRAISARTSVAPQILFTVFSDFAQKLVKLFDHCDRFIHPGKQIVEVALFEFEGFAVLPGTAGLAPTHGEFLADRGQAASAAGQTHVEENSKLQTPNFRETPN